MVDSDESRLDLLKRLDKFYQSMPISYFPQTLNFLGRTVNWINEVYHYSKFSLLIPLFLDGGKKGESDIENEFEKSIDAMVNLASGFVTFSNNQVSNDQSYLFFSKILFIALLVHCLMGKVDLEKVGVIVSAINLTGYPQDSEVIYGAVVEKGIARKTLKELLSF